MSKATLLGKEEVTIKDQLVSGCLTFSAPFVLLVAGYIVRHSWAGVAGAEHAIFGDSRLLNVAILVVGLFFCGCSLLVLINGLWKTKMKFYDRGLTLHGIGVLGSTDRTRFLYSDIALVHITEKHNLTDERRTGFPRRYAFKRDLVEVGFDALWGKKVEKEPPPKFYENTEYTLRFTSKTSEEAVIVITLDRADQEIPAITDRLEMEGVKVSRKLDRQGGSRIRVRSQR